MRIKDIALRAGVSTGTVDRVIHGRKEVNKSTREKVLKIIEELGYQPNLLARSLASKKTIKIAIVIPDSSENNPYWKKPVHGINMAAEELVSFNIKIIYKYFDASNQESFKAVLEEVCDEKPEGLVLNPVFKSISLHYINIFNSNNIPYVFIDINLKAKGQLSYLGQDAEQSGVVAAKLMASTMPISSNIHIVKLSNNKVFSQHIESRVAGFLKFYAQNESVKATKLNTVEIDLSDDKEPDYSLSKVFKSTEAINGIFVPNSRAFKVADFLTQNKLIGIETIGYDLIEQNIKHLEEGNISYLISQDPEGQAYNSIMVLFNHLVMRTKVQKTIYSPIDIIIKENLEYYIGKNKNK